MINRLSLNLYDLFDIRITKLTLVLLISVLFELMRMIYSPQLQRLVFFLVKPLRF